MRSRSYSALSLFVLVALCLPSRPQAQTPLTPAQAERAAAGDAPEDPGPLATGLSPALTPKAIEAAMRKVAGWQIGHASGKWNQQWTYAPLYTGLIATTPPHSCKTIGAVRGPNLTPMF